MEAPRRLRHTGAHDGDHGARREGPYRVTQNIMFIHYVFLIHAYILDIRDGSINKMIPQLIPTNVSPLNVHHQESSPL